MQISSKVENIFSLAVGLEQKGLGKSIVYCMGDVIYIVNYDRTIMVKFKTGQDFAETPLVFYANDYDSPKVGESKGMIQFEQMNTDFIRVKSSKAPEGTFEEIDELYESMGEGKKEGANGFGIPRSVLDLIEPSLSHVELFSENKSLVLVQRDIYTGNIITIRRNDKGILKGMHDSIKKDFEPYGIRTVDFQALFVFSDFLTFKEIEPGVLHFKGTGCDGFLATCTYDELGTINYAKGGSDGREKQKGRNTEQETGGQVKKLARRKC